MSIVTVSAKIVPSNAVYSISMALHYCMSVLAGLPQFSICQHVFVLSSATSIGPSATGLLIFQLWARHASLVHCGRLLSRFSWWCTDFIVKWLSSVLGPLPLLVPPLCCYGAYFQSNHLLHLTISSRLKLAFIMLSDELSLDFFVFVSLSKLV